MEVGIGAALQYSALGICIVFAMIIVLMIVVSIMSAVLNRIPVGTKKSEKVKVEAVDDNTVQNKVLAPGSAGDIKLYNVSDRDAAMIMAIVADKMQVPLNELRFYSIKEIDNA